MRVASSRCSVLDGTVALRLDAPPLWWSATGDLTASRPHVLAHMGHGLRPLLLARVAKNRRCLPPAHRAPAAKTTTSKALLWPVALSDHCSVILFNYSCLELKFWLLLWICYDHYNLSSIILCICFETWHTQPQIPGSATADQDPRVADVSSSLSHSFFFLSNPLEHASLPAAASYLLHCCEAATSLLSHLSYPSMLLPLPG